MDAKLEDIKGSLLASSGAAKDPPRWLERLLASVPGSPAEVVPHHRPIHGDLQGAIADSSFHPAIEACLHLINADLYSAHFMVRKAQGGSRYSDWLHAILHKLEGDYRNAKMWYTDLGNNNASDDDQSSLSSNHGRPVAETFRRLQQFWCVPATNGGTGDRAQGEDLDLSEIRNGPRDLLLTAHGHTDLVFLSSLTSKVGTSSAKSDGSAMREVERHYLETTHSEDKIKASKSAFELDELHLLYDRLRTDRTSLAAVGSLTKLELVWMLRSLAQDFGWRKYGIAETLEAMKVGSTPAQESIDEERNSKAANMVFEPGKGQRRF